MRTLTGGEWTFTDEQWERAQTRMLQIQDKIESGEIEADEAWKKSILIEQIRDKERALQNKLNAQEYDDPNVAEIEMVENRLKTQKTQRAELMQLFGQTPEKRELSDAQKKQADLIEMLRKLMQKEKDSGAWPTGKKGREGFLKFVWRKHEPEIKRYYGNVEYETIRRKTTPCDCDSLGLKELPKG